MVKIGVKIEKISILGVKIKEKKIFGLGEVLSFKFITEIFLRYLLRNYYKKYISVS